MSEDTMTKGRMIREGDGIHPHVCDPPEALTSSWGRFEYLEGHRLPASRIWHRRVEWGSIWECPCGKQWRLKPNDEWYRKWWRVKR